MDLWHVFNLKRWRSRFRSEDKVLRASMESGKAPDATIDEVGTPSDNVGFTGRPIRSRTGNGQTSLHLNGLAGSGT